MVSVHPVLYFYFFLGKSLLLLFMKSSFADALTVGKQFLQVLSPFYFVVSAKLVADGVLRGISAMRQFMTATFIDLVLRVVLAFAFSAWTKMPLGIWCAWPIGWTIAMTCSVFFYKKECRRLRITVQ